MGRVSASAANPMTAQGDTIIGGGGSPTGYGANVARSALGAAGLTVTPGIFSGGLNGPLADADAGWVTTTNPSNGAAYTWDLGVATGPQRIGKLRVFQLNALGVNGFASQVTLAYSIDNVTFVALETWNPAAQDDTHILAVPATARYWRLTAVAVVGSGSFGWGLNTVGAFPVTTVGAGNMTRLAAPPERRVLSYNLATGVPEWQAREAAIAKLADTFGAAGAIVDAGAAYSQANANNNTRSLSDKLDAVIAALQAHGILT